MLATALILAAIVPGPVAAASQDLVPGCAGVNLRTSAWTTAPIKVKLGLGSTVKVSGTVAGARWGTSCPTWKSGSTWYAVSQVNGQAVQARYGVAVLFAATGVLAAPAGGSPSVAAPVVTHDSTTALSAVVPAAASNVPPAPGIALVPACSSVNFRTSASTRAGIKAKLGPSSALTVSGTVAGSAWSATCPTAKSGSTWYRVTHVNGKPVKTLYGVSSLYAAMGVLRAPATVSPPPIGTPPAALAPALPATLPETSTTQPATPATPAAPLPVTAPATLAPSPSPAPASTPVASASLGEVATALGATTTFYGRGWGHGVGMSQYGARGRALAGQLAPEILASYYAGTTIGAIPLDTAIRVLLLDNFAPTATAPLTIYGRGGAWTVAGIGLEFPADARLRLYPPASSTASWRALVETTDGQLFYDGPVARDFRVAGMTEATTIQLFSKPSTYDLYRGTLRVIVSGATVDVVNELPLEAYLRGVVPAEMPTSWPLEARIAQTIVARSYAAYQLRPGSGTFDVYDDTRSQVYLGVRQEKPEADAVIASTAGQVLRYGAALVNAQFHSTAGGATENNENVFVSSTGARVATPVAYLRGASDRDPAGVPYDAGSPYATWQTKAYTSTDLSAIFARDVRTNVGTITALDLRNRGVSGRLISVTLVGSGGTRTVSGAVFVAAFNAGKPSTDPPLRGTLLDVAPIP